MFSAFRYVPSLVLLSVPLHPGSAPTIRYRIESTAEQTVDLSMFGQPNQLTTTTSSAWLAVTVVDSAGGTVLRVVVDSVKYDGTVPPWITPATLDSAKGGTLSGALVQGRARNLTPAPASNGILQTLQGIANNLFPPLKKDARPGDTWADTLEIKNTAGGANTTIKSAYTYTQAEPQASSAGPGTRVTGESSATLSGTVESPQMGTMQIEGKGTGTASYLLDPDGRTISAELKLTLDQLVTVPGAPAPVPVKTIQTTRVSRTN